MSVSVSQRQEFDFLNRLHFCLSSPFSLSLLLFPRLSVLHTSADLFIFFPTYLKFIMKAFCGLLRPNIEGSIFHLLFSSISPLLYLYIYIFGAYLFDLDKVAVADKSRSGKCKIGCGWYKN